MFFHGNHSICWMRNSQSMQNGNYFRVSERKSRRVKKKLLILLDCSCMKRIRCQESTERTNEKELFSQQSMCWIFRREWKKKLLISNTEIYFAWRVIVVNCLCWFCAKNPMKRERLKREKSKFLCAVSFFSVVQNWKISTFRIQNRWIYVRMVVSGTHMFACSPYAHIRKRENLLRCYKFVIRRKIAELPLFSSCISIWWSFLLLLLLNAS